jgi:hypothetical protein
MKNFASVVTALFLLTSTAFAGDYCVAVRGNGEYAPGHWGGMAKLIEEKGLPKTMMGGSSASISLFLMNGVAQNPSLRKASEEEKKKKAALLVKSIPNFLKRMGEKDGVVSLFSLMMGAGGNTDFKGDFVGSLKKLSFEAYKAMESAQQHPGDAGRNAQHFLTKYLPMITPELRAGLSNPATFEVAKKRLLESTAVFGQYKVEGDPHMFFRPGIVDFRYTAMVAGAVADFYAGEGGPEANQKLDDFLARCPGSEIKGECGKLFEGAVDSYLNGKSDIRQFPNKAVFESVGQGKGVETFVTTATMQGESLERFKKLRAAYKTHDESKILPAHGDFHLDYDKELRFTYMGRRDSLAKIQQGLGKRYPTDEKSKKFNNIGDVPWITAIASSAGEPGLTSFQPLLQLPSNPAAAKKAVFAELGKGNDRWEALQKDESAKLYNMGGWSDLHPTLALRSHPACTQKEIVYLTRQGGETCFGQGLFVRLTGGEDKVPFWKEFCEKKDKGYFDWREDPRFASAKGTPWDKLYHYGNSESSYNRSVHESNTLLCTDWDKLTSPFAGASIFEHFDHAYHSKLVTRAERASGQETRVGCSSPLDRKAEGDASADNGATAAQ